MLDIRKIDESLAPILKDFETFIDYLQNNKVKLTSKENWLPPGVLYELNNKMTSYVTPNTTLRTPQKYYVLLNLLYHLAVESKLFNKVKGKGGFYLEPTDRLELYRSLTSTEKYFSLLETFWRDIDWRVIGTSRFSRDFPILPFRLFLFSVFGNPNFAKKHGEVSFSINSQIDQIFLILHLYGLFDVKFSKNDPTIPEKYYIFVSRVSLTPLGNLLLPILAKERDVELWNIPYRKQEFGEPNPIPGSPLRISLKKKAIGTSYEEEPFFLPFTGIFKEELTRTLPRIKEEYKFIDGTYVFKVSLSNNKDIWRKIKIPADYTLADLANVILDAYRFDYEHLYSFFMDGKKWSAHEYTSPESEEGPHSDMVQIDELGLKEGQSFLFLYDYGREWCFDVKLEKIEEKKIDKAKISERHGRSPAQYPEW